MMKKIGFSSVRITGGFWKTKQELIRKTTLYSVYHRFQDTHRFDALKCDWKEKGEYNGHIFWDSDVAKWLESAAYALEFERDAELEKIVDDTVALILKNRDENGYFNSYYLTVDQDQRFTIRDNHELYCAGHLMEAAVAYYHATGKDAFLKAMCRYADYIEKVFMIEKSAAFLTPGHPEIELALVRLYEATGEKRYLALSKYFIDTHGTAQEKLYADTRNPLYNMDEMPIRERSTAEGHSVRALYLMSGAADIAHACQDQELMDACKRVYDNIVNHRMYITGGVGSTYIGEAFTVDYDLPTRTAYAETCAAIALAYYCVRMQKIHESAIYADTLERVIYNGILSGLSMDGKSFFYENPLEIDPAFNDVDKSAVKKSRYPITQRLEVFNCSCCPPNVTRFFLSLGDYLYACNEDTVFVNQYMASEMKVEGLSVTQQTNYPVNGEIRITCEGKKKEIALRIPAWCQKFTVNHPYRMQDGYARIALQGKTEIILSLDMPVLAMAANPKAHALAGKIAIMRGPVVYCAEGVDNGEDLSSIRLSPDAEFTLGDCEFLLPNLHASALRQKKADGLYTVAGDDYEEIFLKLIPYYAFANRGETEMITWINRK